MQRHAYDFPYVVQTFESPLAQEAKSKTAEWPSGTLLLSVVLSRDVTRPFLLGVFLESTFKDQINPKRQTAFPLTRIGDRRNWTSRRHG